MPPGYQPYEGYSSAKRLAAERSARAAISGIRPDVCKKVPKNWIKRVTDIKKDKRAHIIDVISG